MEAQYKELQKILDKVTDLKNSMTWFEGMTNMSLISKVSVNQYIDKLTKELAQLETQICHHDWEFVGENGEGSIICKHCRERNPNIIC